MKAKNKRQSLTTEQAMEFFGVSVYSIRSWCKKGKLKAKRVRTGQGSHEPYRWLIDAQSAREFKAKRDAEREAEGGTNIYVSRDDKWRKVIQGVVDPEQRAIALENYAVKLIGPDELERRLA